MSKPLQRCVAEPSIVPQGGFDLLNFWSETLQEWVVVGSHAPLSDWYCRSIGGTRSARPDGTENLRALGRKQAEELLRRFGCNAE